MEEGVEEEQVVVEEGGEGVVAGDEVVVEDGEAEDETTVVAEGEGPRKLFPHYNGENDLTSCDILLNLRGYKRNTTLETTKLRKLTLISYFQQTTFVIHILHDGMCH